MVLHDKWGLFSDMFCYVGWSWLPGRISSAFKKGETSCFTYSLVLHLIKCEITFCFGLLSPGSSEFTIFYLKIIGCLSPDGCICTVAHVFYHHRTDLMHSFKFWISNVTTVSESVISSYEGEEKQQFQVETYSLCTCFWNSKDIIS